MAFVAKYVGGKYLKKSLSGRFSSEDVYYETKEVQSRTGKTKLKKVWKDLPPGLTKEEEEAFLKIRKRAHTLDMALFSFLGTRFGWSALVGVVPGVGDVLDLIMAYLLVQKCNHMEVLTDGDKALMTVNMGVDFGIGLVPFLGDIADGVYKCNTRNVAILESRLKKLGQARLAGAGGQQATQEALQGDPEYAQGPPPRYTSTRQQRKPDVSHDAQLVQQGGVRNEDRGFFGGRRQPDLEAGEGIPPPKPARH